VPLWVSGAIRELRNDYSYIYPSAQFGRWASLPLLILSAFAEGKLRIYLMLAVVAIWLFFAITIGELP